MIYLWEEKLYEYINAQENKNYENFTILFCNWKIL